MSEAKMAEATLSEEMLAEMRKKVGARLRIDASPAARRVLARQSRAKEA